MHRTRRCLAVAALASLSIAACVQPAAAQCSQQIIGNDTVAGDYFGGEVAVYGNTMVISAPNDDAPGVTDRGSAYFFTRSGLAWTQQAKLEPTASTSTSYGASLAMNSTFIAVGAPRMSLPTIQVCGGVHLYRRTGNTVSFVTTLTAPDAALLDYFGQSLCMFDNYLYVGAPGDDNARGADAGAVYVYKFDAGTWSYVTKLLAPDGVAGDGFGYAVSASYARVAATSFYASTPGHSNNGAVYVFNHPDADVFGFDAKIIPDDAYNISEFGNCIAVTDQRLVVADPHHAAPGLVHAGKVYLFTRAGAGSWPQRDSATPTPVLNGQSFGVSMSMEGSRVALAGAGAAALFEIDATEHFVQTDFFTDPVPTPEDYFGTGIGISGTQLIVGDAENGASPNQYTGLAHAFTLVDHDADECVSATPMYLNWPVDGCTTGATPSNAGPSCGNSIASPDVFYAFTAPCDGLFAFTTDGSTFDTVLSLHWACPANPASALACNDDIDGANNRNSRISVGLLANTTYYIRVSGFNGAAGTYRLMATATFNPPANDACSASTLVAAGPHPFASCGATTEGFVYTGCTLGTDDIWYRFVAPAGGTCIIDTCNHNFDTTLDIWAGGCLQAASAPMVCNDDFCAGFGSKVSFQATAGQQYLIRVGAWGGGGGSGVLNIDLQACPCDWNHSGAVNSQDYFDFLTAFFGGNADYNQNGQTNSQDFFDFLACFFTGC